MTGGGVTLDSVDCGCSAVIVEPMTDTYIKPYSVGCCERVFLDASRTYLYLARPGLVRLTLVGDCDDGVVIMRDAPERFEPSLVEQGCCSTGSAGALCEQLGDLPLVTLAPTDPFPSFNFSVQTLAGQCYRYPSTVFEKLANLCANLRATPVAPGTLAGIPSVTVLGHHPGDDACYRFPLTQLFPNSAGLCQMTQDVPVAAMTQLEAPETRVFGRREDDSCAMFTLPPLTIVNDDGLDAPIPFATFIVDENRRYSFKVAYSASNFATTARAAIASSPAQSPNLLHPNVFRISSGGSVATTPVSQLGRAVPAASTPPVRVLGQTSSGDIVSVALVPLELRDCSNTLIGRFLVIEA
jgi:hypothetical protein